MKQVKPMNKNSNTDFENKGYFIKNSCYYKYNYSKGNQKSEVKLSNFTMEIIYHFNDGTNDTKRLIKLKHHSGKLSWIEINNSQTSIEKFETILKSNKCSFLGSGYELKLIFADLMDKEKEAIYLHQLGYNNDENIYCFSNAIINQANKLIFVNDLGIIKDKKDYYLPAHAGNNKIDKSFDNERKFIYKQGDIDLKEYLNTFFLAYGINAIIGISFLISSLFRDIVIKETNFFPFLFLFGKGGTGKSSYIDILTRVFGEKDTGSPIKGSSVKGIARKCSQRKNSMIFLKEYTNQIDDDMVYFFKNAYDGVTYTIAQNTTDSKTNTFIVESGIILDGNSLPTKEGPMFERVIILNFNDNIFNYDQGEAYKKLKDQSDIGLGQVLFQILKERKYFDSEYKKSFRTIINLLKTDKDVSQDIKHLPERILKHTAFILTPIWIFYKKLKFITENQYQELEQKIFLDAIEKNEMTIELSDVNNFWESLNFEISKSFTNFALNKQYQIDKFEKILYLKFKETFPFYVDYCQKLKINFLDTTTLKKVLTSEPYFIPSTQKGRDKAIVVKGFGSCYQFRITINNETDKISINDKIMNL